MRFVILPGQAHDHLTGVAEPLEDLRFGTLIGDKAYNAEWLLEEVEGNGATAVIPSKRNRTQPLDNECEMYKWRHQIKNFFAGIKEFRAVATLCYKTEESLRRRFTSSPAWSQQHDCQQAQVVQNPSSQTGGKKSGRCSEPLWVQKVHRSSFQNSNNKLGRSKEIERLLFEKCVLYRISNLLQAFQVVLDSLRQAAIFAGNHLAQQKRSSVFLDNLHPTTFEELMQQISPSDVCLNSKFLCLELEGRAAENLNGQEHCFSGTDQPFVVVYIQTSLRNVALLLSPKKIRVRLQVLGRLCRPV